MRKEKLGYRPNPAAKALAVGCGNVVLFVVPDVHLGNLTVEVMSRLTGILAKQRLMMAVHFASADGPEQLSVVRGVHPRAVLSMQHLEERAVAALEELSAHVVSIEHDANEWGPTGDATSTIQVDRIAAFGHSRIGFADTPRTKDCKGFPTPGTAGRRVHLTNATSPPRCERNLLYRGGAGADH